MLFKKKILFIYWPWWVFVAAQGLPLLVSSVGLLFIVVCGLPIAVASLS